ncbi:MAG: amino acid ABC transporter permease [Chloroflexi bacterium]|nr:amino acid ABC transporter permease [Chloroflexota bacterium]
MIATRPVDPRSSALRARRWAHDNLFSSRANTTLTIVTLLVFSTITVTVLRFLFLSADFSVIETNRRLLFLGRFPAGEEWRLWPPLWALMGAGALSFGLWLRVDWLGWTFVATILAFAYLPHALQLLEGTNALLFAIGLVLAGGGYALARLRVRGSRYEGRVRVAAVAALALVLPLTLLMLRIDGGVRTTLWGGLLLNMMLATVGIVVGFPLGVLLALGRASSYPVIRWTAAGYIEVVRAAPLVAWLFIARFVLPDFLPPVVGLDDLDIVVRAMLVLAGFTGAYVAEVVRGGLQSVARGQIEAAQALGMNTLHTTGWIVLPQALRAVIPALVSQFISLWKDTTLVFTLGLTELLGAGRATLSQEEFIGRQQEVLAFVALIFWVIAFAMSRLSQRIERGLGVGVR